MDKMCFKSKKTILFVLFCCLSLPFVAQNDREFRAEIGLFGGVAYYIGDANLTPFRNITPAYGALFRYRFDTRFAARAEFARSSVTGGLDGFNFENTIHAFDLAGEFNFFDLENNPHARFSRIFSPYIFLGIGAMHHYYAEENATQKCPVVNLSMPFGVGVKVKLGNRWNLNAQWSNRLLFADNLEGIFVFNDPHGLNGRNPFNNDLFSTFTIGLTFDIWRRECECVGFVNADNRRRRR